MNKPFSILLFFLLLSCSCSRKLLPSSTNTTIVDHNTTVTERIVWQSKIITLPVEHTQQVTFEDSSHLETPLAISDARIMADGRLFHSLKNKTNFLQDSIPSLEKETVVTKDSIITVEKIVEVEVEKELSKWQKILISLGYIGIGFILFSGYKIVRKFV